MIARRVKNTEEPNKSYFKEIERGLLQFKAYQTTSAFRIDEAVIASSKVALLATQIRAGRMNPLPRFSPTAVKADYLIQHPDYIYLIKLHAEPLFYWYHTLNLIYPGDKKEGAGTG